MSLIHEELTYKLNGIFFEIQNKFGRVLKEDQYSNLIAAYLKRAKISFQRELPLTIEENIRGNVADFLIENKIVLEIKTRQFIGKEEYFQVKRYLMAANLKLGILVNFHSRKMNPQRIINRHGLLKRDPH